MAWNDPVQDEKLRAARGAIPRRGIDVGAARDTAVRGLQERAEIRGDTAEAISTMSQQAAPQQAGWEPSELAYNPNTKKWAIQARDGTIREVDQTPANLFALAESDLPPMADLPEGYRPVTKAQLQNTLAGIAEESDFFGQMGSSFLQSVGLAASAIDSLIGNDDPNNYLTGAAERHADQQTVGEYKSSQGPWFTSVDRFMSGLGQTVGNIGGAAVGAIPGIVAGSVAGTAAAPGAGTVAGALTSAGVAVTGGMQAFGEQATEFYSTAVEELSAMDPEEAATEVPLYAELLTQNPGASHEELTREVAIRGARAAGAPAAGLGAVEALVGGRLMGNILRRTGLSRASGAKPGISDEAVRRGSVVGTTARFGARATAGGAAAGITEMLESGLGQAAGARLTGIGDPTVSGNMDIREGIAAAQAGFLLGGFGNTSGNRARADIGEALNQTAGATSPTDAATPAGLPAVIPPASTQGVPVGGPTVSPNRDTLRRPVDVEFTDVTPQAALPAPQQAALPAPQEPIPMGPPPAEPPMQQLEAPAQSVQDQYAAEEQRQFARQAFAEFFNINPDDEQAMQQAMPELLDLADQYPQVRAVMEAAGVYPNMIEQSPESQQAALAQAQQGFVQQPAPPATAPRPGNQVAPPPEQATNWRSRIRGPESAQRAAVSMQVPPQVESPEPIAAPAERTPDGRPMGVAPAPSVNPEPMPPGQAAQAAQTRATRRGRAGAAPSPVAAQEAAAPADVAAAAAVSEQGVTPSTPEPAGDIAAQLEAMVDPESDRTAVFVAAGNDAQIPADLVPPDAFVAKHRTRGTLITFDEAEAKRFRRGKWTDADTQRALGYSENKADVIGAGEEPVVVEARTPDGRVAAQQIATPTNARAAAAAVRRQARSNATVATTTPERAQAERTARSAEPAPVAPKLAQVKAALAARSSKKKSAQDAVADEPAPQRRRKEGLNDSTVDERAAAQVKAEGPSRAAPRLDVSSAAKNRPATVKVGGQTRQIRDSLIVETGERGDVVDLRVQAVDAEQRVALTAALEGKMSAADAAEVERVLRNMDQLDTMLDAAADAAEERLLDRLDASVEGRSLLDAMKAITLREELRARRAAREAAGQDNRGRPPGRPVESPLTYVPLLAEESLHFGRLVRQQAASEAANPVEPARSVARRLISQILPNMADRLENVETLRETVEAFSKLTDEQLDAHVRAAHPRLKDSQLAKQVMRGASEVAHVQAQREAEAVTGAKRKGTKADAPAKRAPVEPVDPAELGLEEVKVGRVDTFEGDLPEEAISTINGWLDMLERAGTKMTGRMQVISWGTAQQLYPEHFQRSSMGRYAQVLVNGEPVHVVAIDWDRIASDAYAIEVLAHEFGHYVSTEVFNRSDRATQDAVKASYKAWKELQGGRQPLEIFRDHAPHLLRTLAVEDGPLTHEYATDFAEWSANHVARFLLTRPEPRGIVEKYFARIADLLRKIWADVTGSAEPDASWAEALDGWIARGAAANAGPHRMDTGPHDMAWLGEQGEDSADPPGRRTAGAVASRVTAPLRATKEAWSTVLGADPGKRVEAASELGDSLYDKMMSTQFGKILRRVGLSLMTLDQIERRFRSSPLGKSLSVWVRLMKEKAQLANVVLNGNANFTLPGGEKVSFIGAADVLERAGQLAPKVRDLLQDVMYYATHYAVHPDQTWEQNKHLHEGKAERVVKANRRRYEHVAALWAQLAATETDATQIYAELRDAFMQVHEKTLERQIGNIEESDFSDKAKADWIQKIKAYRRTLKDGPYFPLMRFGDWVVSVTQPTDEATLHASRAAAEQEKRIQKALNPGARINVEKVGDEWAVRVYRRGVYFFDSAAEARAAREQIEADLREQYETAGVDIEDVRRAVEDGSLSEDGKPAPLISEPFEKQAFYAGVGDGSSFINELRAELKASNMKLDPELAAIMESLYIESLPELSVRKSMLPRQNVLGASRKMLTSYAVRFHGAANAYAGVTYGRQIDKAWRDMQAVHGFEPAGAVLNNLRASQQALADRLRDTMGNRILNALTDASSLFSLAFSPAYIMTNAMQPWMITLPTLAGTIDSKGNLIGAAKATKYLREAYAEAPKFFTKRGIADFVDEAKRLFNQPSDAQGLHKSAELMVMQFGKTQAERDMLMRMLESGRLDFSFLNSVEDAMRGGVASQKFGNVARLGMALPSQVEAMNRVVTALATFRMAKNEMGFDDAQATDHAYDVVGDTQLDYSRLNRPLLFNKPLLSVILQFKLYLQGMYALFVRNAYLLLKGKTAEEKKQGRATLMYLMGTHAAIGGAAGLGPLAFVAKFGVGLAAMMMGRDDEDDEWKSPEQILSEKARYVFGDTGGQLVERGLPTLLGLDVADRIGFPSLIDSRYANIRDGDDAGTGLDKWTLYFMGAPYSNVRRVVRAGGEIAGADTMDEARRALVAGLPSGPRAIAKALSVSHEGILERDGDTFISPDELGWADIAITAMGYQPSKVSRSYRERTEEKGTIARIREERSGILQRWRTSDPGDRVELRREVKAFNATVPRGFQIGSGDLAKSERAYKSREAGRVGKDEQAIRDYLK